MSSPEKRYGILPIPNTLNIMLKTRRKISKATTCVLLNIKKRYENSIKTFDFVILFIHTEQR